MMKSCESYEMHISALMDAEASRGDTLAILDHLPACASCQAFYRDCRQLQDVADGMATTSEVGGDETGTEPTAIAAAGSAGEFKTAGVEAGADARIVAFPRPSRWVWAAAASIALFLVAASLWMRPSVPTVLDTGPHVIDLSLQKPDEDMDDTRFMEISVALLHAEPRYQRTMIEILERFERNRGLDESSVDVAATESGEPWISEFDETEARDTTTAQPQP